MQVIHQMIAVEDFNANTNEAFTMLAEGPVVVLSKATPKAVLVSVEEWNQIARRLKMLETLIEAQRIQVRNEADQTWVSSAEMKARFAAAIDPTD